MKQEQGYPTDQELEQLIALTEQEELVQAPPELEERILRSLGISGAHQEALPESRRLYFPSGIENKMSAIPVKSKEERKTEFRRYCFRVLTSVVAAVLIVFTVPSLLDTVSLELRSRPAQTSEQNYPTKEEYLKKQSLLESAFGNKRIFHMNRFGKEG